MSVNWALIGHTGFVGSNLASQRQFAFCYNSQNFRDIARCPADFAVCCGVRAEKWKANQNPVEDMHNIMLLFRQLRELRCRRIYLISTVDVYSPATQQRRPDETVDPLTGDNEPYGFNRACLEEMCRHIPSPVAVIRLPALYGPGLKKNALFDLLHGRDEFIAKIHPHDMYQWWDVRFAHTAIELVHPLPEVTTLNIAPLPVPMQKIVERFFPDKLPLLGQDVGDRPPRFYDTLTRYGMMWHCGNGYTLKEEPVLDAIGNWLREARACV